MEALNQFIVWVKANETALSGMAAIVVISGMLFSPVGASIRGALGRNGKQKAEPVAAVVPTPVVPAAESVVEDVHANYPPLITDKPSIAVLPFVNMSKNEDQEYFADGMTEDILSGLACDSRLFVIARNSSFVYKGKAVDVRAVGKELGVRYVLEGSIRPVTDRLRITVQLIETDTGSHIWADKIDRPMADIFEVQDEVVDSLVTTLCANLGVAEGNRARRQTPENLKAWELCIEAEMAWIGQRTTGGMAEAQALAKKATEVEPEYALGWAMRAFFSSVSIPYLLTDDNAEVAQQVGQLISKAAQLAPNDPTVLGYIGGAYTYCGKASIGLGYLERSLSLNPNSGLFRYNYAASLMFVSRTEDALEQLNLFFRQSPKDPSTGLAYFYKGTVFNLMTEYSEAEKSASLGIKSQPTFPWLYNLRAMALVELEQHDEARQMIQVTRELAPQFSLVKIEEAWRFLCENPDDTEKLVNLTRQAWQGA